MIDDTIKKEILHRINMAEQEHSVKVLYAIESGSRAWGFASPNSDYDVRFIYAHSKEWYLSVDLEDKRDVIEYEIIDDIDINGWDIRKALKLFSRSNPSIVEWLQSPIIYIDDNSFAPAARQLLHTSYSIEKGIYHYYSMAKTNYRSSLRDDIVPLKKYFYVLRPLLSILWLEQFQQPPPIEFDKLRTLVADNAPLSHAITQLLERKKQSMEKEHIPMVPLLNTFIKSELQRLETYKSKPTNDTPSMETLNRLFHSCIG